MPGAADSQPREPLPQVEAEVAYNETLSHCRALRRGVASAASSSSPGSTISPTTKALAEEDGETPRSETAAAAATAS